MNHTNYIVMFIIKGYYGFVGYNYDRILMNYLRGTKTSEESFMISIDSLKLTFKPGNEI